MRSYSSREVIQKLNQDGWYEVGCEGDHHQLKHPVVKDTYVFPAVLDYAEDGISSGESNRHGLCQIPAELW